MLRGVTCLLVMVVAFLAARCCVLVQALTDAAVAMPAQLTETRVALVGEVRATRADLTAQVAAARRDVLVRSERQVAGLRADLVAETDAIRATADRRIGDTLARADAALATVEGIRADAKPVIDGAATAMADVKPVLVNAAAFEKDAQDSWDDSYWDVKASVESGTVAMNQVAQAAEQMRSAAVTNAANVAGITGDIHTLTTAATKPKSVLGKIWAFVTTASRFAGLF